MFFVLNIVILSDDSQASIKRRLHGNVEISNLYDKLLVEREKKILEPNTNVQHPDLKPILRPYQVLAVQWMIHRENINSIENGTYVFSNIIL